MDADWLRALLLAVQAVQARALAGDPLVAVLGALAEHGSALTACALAAVYVGSDPPAPAAAGPAAAHPDGAALQHAGLATVRFPRTARTPRPLRDTTRRGWVALPLCHENAPQGWLVLHDPEHRLVHSALAELEPLCTAAGGVVAARMAAGPPQDGGWAVRDVAVLPQECPAALARDAERFRALVSGSVEGILVHRDWQPLFANQAYADIFGYESPEAVMALPTVNPMLAPHERRRKRELGRRRLAGRRVRTRYEFDGLRRDGRPIRLDSIHSLVDWDGRPAILTTVYDVTARHRSEREREAERRRVQAVLDALPLRVAAKDCEGRYLLVNRTLAEALGQPPQALIGRTVAHVNGWDAEARARVERTDGEIVAGERERITYDAHVREGPGHTVDLRVVKTPLRDEAGTTVGVVSIGDDISERRRSEREREAEQRLVQTVLDALPHRVAAKDREGRYRLVNAPLARAMDRPLDEVLGRTNPELAAWKPGLLARSEDADARVLAGEADQVSYVFEEPDAEGRTRRRYVVKTPLRDEARAVVGVVSVGEDVTELHAAAEAALLANRRLQDAIESLPAGFLLYDSDQRLVLWNTWMERNFPAMAPHYREGAAIETSARAFARTYLGYGEAEAQAWAQERAAGLDEAAPPLEVRLVDGRWIRRIDQPTRDGGLVGLRFDVTEEKEREGERRQALKLEAVAQLTGGVAHNFNNLLTILLGNLQLLERRVPEDEAALDMLARMQEAAERGAAVVRHLEGFTRARALRPRVVDVNGALHELAFALRGTLGEGVALVLELDPRVWPVYVDRGQLGVALLNLAANARDAMAGEGRVVVRTRRADLHGERAAEAAGVAPGDYTVISVRDTGTGIPMEILHRVFDPFFTTRPPGEGSGLGLSMVYGFARQSDGNVTLANAPGGGVVAELLLPRWRGERPDGGGANSVEP